MDGLDAANGRHLWSHRLQFRLAHPARHAACAYFASRGLVCATVEYQLPNQAAIRAMPAGQSHRRLCVTDAKSSIRWFKAHAAELGVDPERVIAGGGSAGAHISAIATMNPGLNDPADPDEL